MAPRKHNYVHGLDRPEWCIDCQSPCSSTAPCQGCKPSVHRQESNEEHFARLYQTSPLVEETDGR